ncbi:hypothetical protein [Clostridium sp.]|jgi:hypothetical protein|uniref:hypothetical protein n=1 Tax=Clostridium sp. TaxID=1506 RepID=UPI003EEB6274
MNDNLDDLFDENKLNKEIKKGKLKSTIMMATISSVVIIICILITFNVFTQKEKTIENNKKIATEITKTYYNNIADKNYYKAFHTFYYEDNKMYKEDIKNIGKYKTHDIKSYEKNPNWVIQVMYDESVKSYIVKSTGISSYENETYNFYEEVYIKKIGTELKIYKINTDDKFYYIRGKKFTKASENDKSLKLPPISFNFFSFSPRI